MDKIFSVKYLLKSINSKDTIQYGDDEDVFEEVIVLVRADGKDDAMKKVIDQYEELTYENAAGGMTTWQFVTVLDCYELVDNIEGDIDFKEVYSRYILVETGTTAEEVIQQYALDK
ncbi:DUF4288 domain-containing protein [Sporosarcina oncorhynchi]|uniref:DUF4288 domain-containing protein n=1 Tax=Sporosarcina oncorhynchi TaxID=3056444 RepID=A0ABZ0L504_9BACL|nr:DUF4288 domain-containing protein [Sporosarcina sp. T2O-4]WOV87578.1 DUF4288 domain-containing protein [Sporosarcina sp. T2O-4]